jgi:hypothetical protein
MEAIHGKPAEGLPVRHESFFTLMHLPEWKP